MSEISRPVTAALGVVTIVIVAFGVLSFSNVFLPPTNTTTTTTTTTAVTTTTPVEPEYTVLLSGSLQDVDDVHKGNGTVQLVESDTGSQSIRFIEVTITDGPDLYVYLSKKSSFSGADDDPGEYVDLGLTPAVTGNFTVPVPSSVNGVEYVSVLIWCKRFAALFTYAILE